MQNREEIEKEFERHLEFCTDEQLEDLIRLMRVPHEPKLGTIPKWIVLIGLMVWLGRYMGIFIVNESNIFILLVLFGLMILICILLFHSIIFRYMKIQKERTMAEQDILLFKKMKVNFYLQKIRAREQYYKNLDYKETIKKRRKHKNNISDRL